MVNVSWILVLVFSFMFLNCGKKEGEEITTSSGLKYIDIKVGSGDSPTKGQKVSVHYTDWLTGESPGEVGKKFDSSLDREKPYEFPIGMGRVIKG